MISYQLHKFEYKMLADHIGGPECHEVWRGDCVDLGVTLHWALTAKHSYQQQQPKRLYTREEVVRLATPVNPGNCMSTRVWNNIAFVCNTIIGKRIVDTNMPFLYLDSMSCSSVQVLCLLKGSFSKSAKVSNLHLQIVTYLITIHYQPSWPRKMLGHNKKCCCTLWGQP